MTRGSLSRNLLIVAWPIMLSFLLQMLHNLVDAFWLGKLGRTALVAPTITMNIVFLGLSLAMGMGAGGTTLVSQFRGAGRFQEMRKTGGQMLLLLVVCGFLLSGISFLFSAEILRLMQTPKDAFSETHIYLRWVLLGVPFMFTFLVYQSVLTGIGDTVGPLKINFITVALNMVLDPLLIFGIGPFPKLGVAGAAIATCFARFIAAIIGLHQLFSGSRGFLLTGEDLKPDRSIILKIVKIGIPMGLGQSGTSLGFTLLMGIVNSFGSAVTAAFGIGTRIIHIAMVPAFGLSQANATAVGQNLGRGYEERVSQSVRRACILIGVILVPITTAMFIWGRDISRIFIDDPAVIQYGKELFRITSPSVFAFGFVMVLMGSFQGSGHTVPVMVLNLSRLWLLRIPMTYVMAIVYGMGPTGLWWAMFVSNAVIAVAAMFWFSRGTWRASVIHDEKDLAPPSD